MHKITIQLEHALDKVESGSALIACRFAYALKAGWSPNRIMEYFPPESKEFAKRILDIVIDEGRNGQWL